MSTVPGWSSRWRRPLRLAQAALITGIFGLLLFRSAYRNTGFVLLMNYFLSPEAASNDARLATLQGVFDNLSAQDGDRYQRYRLYLEALNREGADSVFQRYELGSTALRSARVAASGGDFEAAIAQYKAAVNSGADPVRLVAQLEWADLLSRQGDMQGSEARFAEAAAVTPATIVGFGECSGWQFRGGFVDRIAIEANQPVAVVLVWQVPTEQDETAAMPPLSIAAGWRTYRWRDLIYQVGDAANLLPDGGFVQSGLSNQGMPQGYTKTFGSQLPTETRVVADPLNPERQTVLLLDRGPGHSVGIRSAATAVPADRGQLTYLVTLDYHSSPSSEPRIGLRWALRGAKNPVDNATDYVTRKAAADWTSLVRLVPPHEDAETVQFLAMETGKESQLYLDSLALLEVPLICIPES